MSHPKQLSLFAPPIPQVEGDVYSGKDLGTFKDSLRAPIHRWFRYPAGYSYQFVHESFAIFGMRPGDWVYDPFSGTGTTLVCAKQQNIHGYGVEAHPFVHQVAATKLAWDFDTAHFNQIARLVFAHASDYISAHQADEKWLTAFPELIYKCYHPQDLHTLYLLREFIQQEVADTPIQPLLKLALTDTLRGAAAAGTGWPYIAPRKNTGTAPPKNALRVFQQTVDGMVADLRTVTLRQYTATIHNIHGDSRQRQMIADEQIKLILTSPPYLNNYDYADRTRLEMYFWGMTHTWRDITEQVRNKLIVAATTQINRSDYDIETLLDTTLQTIAPATYQTIQTAVLQLARLRNQKGGKKSYDLMVALYFNAMLAVMQEAYRVLQKGGHFCLVLGDSAPYDVHIATDDLIGQIGVGLGFQSYQYHELRGRGDKWRGNPQRHHVPLREGVIILAK